MPPIVIYIKVFELIIFNYLTNDLKGGHYMSFTQKEAKHFNKGDYIMIDDAPCKVVENAKSAPGKHGHLKCKITAVGLIDGNKRMIMKPGDAKITAPIIDKRTAQIVSISGNTAQLMDTETYDMFELEIPKEVEGSPTEGGNAEYWVIGDTKVIMAFK